MQEYVLGLPDSRHIAYSGDIARLCREGTRQPTTTCGDCMGWSCRVEAGDTMDKVQAACIAQTGSANTWTDGQRTYFLEASRTEHADGAITGTVFRMLGDSMAQRSGSFRIDGDGTMARIPASLKTLIR